MHLNDCFGGDTSSKNSGKRAQLSHWRGLIGPAMIANEYITIRWRDGDALRRERVVPLSWKGRQHLVTVCGKSIELNKIEEVKK